jgi:hypothetical protein
MEMDDRIRKLAQWYYDRLHQDTRTNGDKYYKFCTKVSTDGTGDERLPEHEETACRALAFACHESGNNMLPDDWKYEFLNEALGAIVDASDFDEIELEADIYNSDLLRWLSSHGERPGYCDAAVEEGLTAEPSDMMARIQMGQYMEKREVLGAVLAHLREEVEAEEEREEEEAAEREAATEQE